MKKIILFNVPTYGNIGDTAIAVGEEKFILDNFPQYKYLKVLDTELEEGIKRIKNIITNDDIIVLQGGGNFGDEYIDHEERRRRVVTEFPNNKIIVMPVTIYFNNTEKGRRELENSKKIYSNHNNLFLIAREKTSFELMQKSFPNNKVLLTPDIVLYLNRSENKKRNGALFALRTDGEKVITDADVETIKKAVSKKIEKITVTDTHIGEGFDQIHDDNREKIFNEKLDEFKSAELVVTDRLHGMIFAAITSTPCIALGNYNYKIKSSFEWLKGQGYIKFVDNISNIENDINDLIILKNNCKYNNEYAISELKKIIDIINCN